MRSSPRRVPMHLAAAFLIALTIGSAPSLAATGEGDPLPDIQLQDVTTGEVVSLRSLLADSVGAIVYMQTSCAACRKELMAIKDLQAHYPTVKVVSISVDSGNPARVKRYKDHFNFDFPFLHDPDFQTPELFGFSFTPATVLVDKSGKIAVLKGGFRPGDESELEKNLAELAGK